MKKLLRPLALLLCLVLCLSLLPSQALAAEVTDQPALFAEEAPLVPEDEPEEVLLAEAVEELPEESDAVETVEEEPLEPDEPRTFYGRVVWPQVDDILVLSNSAERDIEKLAAYFEGRSAGLHWIAQSYFKKHRNSEDVVVGLGLAIDSLGNFACNKVEFTNAEDESLGEAIRLHIEAYWRYRKSEMGSTELWLPVRFKSKWVSAVRANR